MGAPFFSIITPCLNGEPYLEVAIESVRRQALAEFPNFAAEADARRRAEVRLVEVGRTFLEIAARCNP